MTREDVRPRLPVALRRLNSRSPPLLRIDALHPGTIDLLAHRLDVFEMHDVLDSPTRRLHADQIIDAGDQDGEPVGGYERWRPRSPIDVTNVDESPLRSVTASSLNGRSASGPRATRRRA